MNKFKNGDRIWDKRHKVMLKVKAIPGDLKYDRFNFLEDCGLLTKEESALIKLKQ